MTTMNGVGRCANGHWLSERNTYRRPSGQTECQTCRQARWKARKRPPPPPKPYPSKAPVTFRRVPCYAEDDVVIVMSAATAMTHHETLCELLGHAEGLLTGDQRKEAKWLSRALEAAILGHDRPGGAGALAGCDPAEISDNGGG